MSTKTIITIRLPLPREQSTNESSFSRKLIIFRMTSVEEAKIHIFVGSFRYAFIVLILEFEIVFVYDLTIHSADKLLNGLWYVPVKPLT